MVEIVSVQQVKDGLNIDHDDWDDSKLPMFIDAASQAVIDYLKDAADDYIGTGGDIASGTELPGNVIMATIMLVGYMLERPDSDPEKEWERGYLPRPVTALLYPLRTPTVA